MRSVSGVLAAALAVTISAAEPPASIPVWPAGAPGSEGKTAKEVVAVSESGEQRVTSVHHPSITPYLPAKEKATGTAILVIPGGGHRMLAITHEGYNVGQKLSRTQVAGF